MSTFAIIVAAGQGSRFSQEIKKQYVPIDGVPVWIKASQPFQESSQIDKILIICPASDILDLQSDIIQYKLSKVVSVISGGERRQDSVYAALQWIISHQEKCEFVFIHDGVRPFVTTFLIDRLWNEKETGAVIPVLPIYDTIKSVTNGWIGQTLDRSSLVRVQTPQLFSFQLLSEGFQWLKENPREVTDDAALMEATGRKVKIIQGDENNIKITTVKDLEVSKIISTPRVDIRVGQGIDVHAFEEGNRIILGGIEIPFTKKLKGHSDADVLIHALCDSLLGAAGLEDIGTHFPDTDLQYKNISSLILLEKVVDKVFASGYTIANIDITVMAEKPKLQPYISEMKISLSKITKVSTSQIAIKAKTTEGLGFIGHQEGMAALAISTLKKYETR